MALTKGYEFTSNEKYMAESESEIVVAPESGDTLYAVVVSIYETSEDFQVKYDLDKPCDLENLEDCYVGDIDIDYQTFKLIRQFYIEEPLAEYYISFTPGYSVFQGNLKFTETSSDTFLTVEYYGTELSFKVFDQNKVTYDNLPN